MSNVLLTTEKLPSKGLVYENIPEEITLKAIEVKEDKMIFGSVNTNGVSRALKSCIIEPKDLSLDDLLPSDEHFIMMKLRIHTYGSDYRVSGECNHCGEIGEFDINLDDLEIFTLPDGFTEPIDCGKLPVSGDTIEVRLLRNRDYDQINSQARKLSKSLKVPFGEVEYGIRLGKHIVSINGEPVEDEHQLQGYIDKMAGKDSAYIWSKIDDIKLGYSSIVEVECPNCGKKFKFVLPMNGEFFRPKFR